MKRQGQYWHTIVVAAMAVLASMGAARGEYRVEWRQVDDLKAVFGTVESTNVIAARARISGTVRDLSVDEGDEVTKGAVIAKVVDDKLPLRIAALDAQINALVARDRQARTDLRRAQTLRDRASSPRRTWTMPAPPATSLPPNWPPAGPSGNWRPSSLPKARSRLRHPAGC